MDFLLGQEEVELDVSDNEGWTPFHAAVCWNQPDAMKKLAEKGADMDLKNLRGETPYGRLTPTFCNPDLVKADLDLLIF